MSIGGMYMAGSAGSTASYSSGDPGRRTFSGLVLVSILSAVVAPGTTAGTLFNPLTLRSIASKTDAGQAAAAGAEHVSAIAELRGLTGLTWDQIATLFGVSRRAAHFWASGKSMAAGHEEHLRRTLGCLRAVDQGNAPANRQALFIRGGTGLAPFDLLVQRQYVEFVATLSHAADRRRTPIRPTLVTADRLPGPPQVLAGARENTAHREVGPPRRATVVRAPRAR